MDKNILVCGTGQSGIYSALLLKKLGAKVTLQDIKDKVVTTEDLEGIDLYLGKTPDDIVKDMDMVVLSPGIPFDSEFVKIARSHNVSVIGEFELASRYFDGLTLAITGTNGKTTTTMMVGDIMKLHASGVAVLGNIGVPYTKEVLSLSKDDVVVAEVSSFQLESIEEFRPHIASVLNLTQDHLDRHKTMENYGSIKERIFMNQKENDYLVLNKDDSYCLDMANRAKSKIFFFSTKTKLDQGAFLDGDNIVLKVNDTITNLLNINELKVIGNHNVENAMAAALMANLAGVPPEIIKKALLDFEPVAHRLELVRTKNGINFYNDSKATNPESAIKSLQAITKPIVLIAGGLNKNSDFTGFVRAFEKKVKTVVLIGQATQEILSVCKNLNFVDTIEATTMDDAVKIAFSNAKEGDAVLLSPACASFDMFNDFNHRGDTFKEIVKKL